MFDNWHCWPFLSVLFKDHISAKIWQSQTIFLLSRFYDRHISEQKFNDSETWTVTGRSFSHLKAVKFHQLRLLGDQFWPISNHFAGKTCRGQIGWQAFVDLFVCVCIFCGVYVCVWVCGKSSLTLWLEAWLAKGGMPLNGRELTDGQHWHHHTKRVSNPGVEYIFWDQQELLACCVLLRVPDVLEFGLVCCPMIVQCRTNDLRLAG